jgi:hypothetical protein
MDDLLIIERITGVDTGEGAMQVTRIYTGSDNRSHFEEIAIPLMPSDYGRMSALVSTGGVIFRETPKDGTLDFHPAPRRQLVVTLSGVGEVECGDGARRRFGAGDILLAEDTTGQGHITREIEGPRLGIFILLPNEFDISTWRSKHSGD